MTLSPGSRLGPYEIRALLGTGGMGEVYLAVDIVTPDGENYAYTFSSALGTLYIAEGIR